MSRFFIGATGASGHRYTETLIRALVRSGHEVHLCVTGAGLKVLRHELGVDGGARGESLQAALPGWLGEDVARSVSTFQVDAIEAPASSGTAGLAAVVLCPASMGTLARVSAGFSSNLVERAADVAIKEGRTLVVVPREAPMSVVHLENLLRLARLGAVVLPAAPGFYHRPKTLQDAVDHLVGKILDRLGVEHAGPRWEGLDEPPAEPGILRREAGET